MLVFWVWWEIVFGITCILSVQYTCVIVSVFIVAGNSVVAGNSSQNENTFLFPMSSFYKEILLGYFIMIQ